MVNNKKKTTFHNRLSKVGLLLKNPMSLVIIVALFAICYYVSIFGIYTLNPNNTSWLLYNPTGSDISQHYLGWSFFRKESWSFPIGVIHGLAFPSGVPITFLDSIPIIAIPLKLISGLLPTSFQYFGMWALGSFVLQGIISIFIFRHWTKNPYIQIIGAIFLITAPVLAARTLAHTALGSQWIILLSILLMIEHKRFSVRRYVDLWSGLYIIAVLVHPYFLPMISLQFVISIILSHKRWLGTVSKLVVPPLSSLVVFWLIGGLYLGKDVNMQSDLGTYALNLDFLFSSGGWSRVIGTLPGPAEGHVYVGLGVLMLLPICIYLFVVKSLSSNTRQIIQNFRGLLSLRTVLIAFVSAGLFIAALSPHVSLGSQVLFDIQLPHRVYEWWSTFRATARLFWPIYYMIIIFSFVYVISMAKKDKVNERPIAIFMALVCVIQVADIYTSPIMNLRKQEFDIYSKNRSASGTDVQKYIQSLVRGQRHMTVVDPISVADFYLLGPIALHSNMTLNTGYFARTPTAKIQQSQAQARNDLTNHRADTKANFYIIIDSTFANKLKSDGYSVQQAGAYFIITQ